MKTACALSALMISVFSSTCHLHGQATPGEGGNAISIELHDVSPLRLIGQIAKENRLPLGVVFGTHPYLCTDRKTIRATASNYSELFEQVLADTGYTIKNENGVYVIWAPDVTEHEAKQLGFRFDRFSATNSDMNDAGQLLAGYISTAIDGAKGFVTASPVGPPSRSFTIRMSSATTTEIANRIVSQDGKGIWVFYPTTVNTRGDPPVRIYGYDDNPGAPMNLDCGRGATLKER